jgi:beta-lactamase class A
MSTGEAAVVPGAQRLRRVVRDLSGVAGVSWGAMIRDLGSGEVAAELDADVVQPVASVGKLLLLLETARRIEDGSLDAGAVLRRRPEDEVADSGLWRHLTVPALTVEDLAVLVGAVSDNLATNVLLRHVGLPAVQALGERLGLASTRLLDRVRDRRVAGSDPPTLALGSADELSGLVVGVAHGTVVSAGVGARVRRWLAMGADLSLVAAPLGLDPLARAGVDEADRGVALWHKTGTDEGVRADVGVVTHRGRGLAYAVVARWEPEGGDRRDAVLAGMHRVGGALLASLAGDEGGPVG